MNRMFENCWSYEGAGIGAWDISSVETLMYTFYGCWQLNSDLSAWDTSSVRDFGWTFAHCRILNRDLRRWDTSALRNCRDMFEGATVFSRAFAPPGLNEDAFWYQ